MTSKRFLHKRRRGLYSSEKSAQMNKARWDADRARRDAEMPDRIRELAEIEIQNLPRKQGDILGVMQWTDSRSGKVRRWIVRIGDRSDRITLEFPGGKPSKSQGWATALPKLRSHLCGRKL